MRKFYVSEIDPGARSLANELRIGLEIIDFCDPRRMEDSEYIRERKNQLATLVPLSLHAPYYELFPSAIDPLVRDVAMLRFTQAVKTCYDLGIRRMVVHSGYNPLIYYPQWFVPRSVEFWREFSDRLPADFELMIENVLDETPAYLCEICDGVNDSRIKICLDTGHVNAYSEIPIDQWITKMGTRIGHIHLHNNDGLQDAHAELSCGSLDMEQVLKLLDAGVPEAGICIESTDAKSCLRYLMEKGYIDVQSL